MYDCCDGQLAKEHPLFSVDKQALQLIVYTDEIETANPLGSYRGHHKLCMLCAHNISSYVITCPFCTGMFYYILGNIQPQFRSSLKCIQLITCVSVPNLQKYGYDMILKPFISDANKWYEVLHLVLWSVYRYMLFWHFFSLGCHNVNKRRETSGAWGSSVSIGWHFGCSQHRRIQSRRGIFPPKVSYVPYNQRPDVNQGNINFNMIASLYQGDHILTPTSLKQDISPQGLLTPTTTTAHYWMVPLYAEDSVTYGIVFSSPLNNIRNFHVVEQLPQDIMHVLLEGVIPYEVCLMLTSFVVENKYFTSNLLNDRIESFSYSTQEMKDKPSPIKPQVFTSAGASISQSCK